MANERDDEQFGKPDREKEFGQDKQQPTGQQPTGQQNPPSEFGQQQGQGQNQGQSSTGQTDRGKSGDTDTLSGAQGFGQGTGAGQSGGPGGAGGSEGTGGFVGSQGTGSGDYLQEEGSTGESDFASQGQGALDNPDEDIETGQPRRDNDIEGGTGA